MRDRRSARARGRILRGGTPEGVRCFGKGLLSAPCRRSKLGCSRCARQKRRRVLGFWPCRSLPIRPQGDVDRVSAGDDRHRRGRGCQTPREDGPPAEPGFPRRYRAGYSTQYLDGAWTMVPDASKRSWVIGPDSPTYGGSDPTGVEGALQQSSGEASPAVVPSPLVESVRGGRGVERRWWGRAQPGLLRQRGAMGTPGRPAPGSRHDALRRYVNAGAVTDGAVKDLPDTSEDPLEAPDDPVICP